METGRIRKLYEKWWHNQTSTCEDPALNLLPVSFYAFTEKQVLTRQQLYINKIMEKITKWITLQHLPLKMQCSFNMCRAFL